MKRGILLLCALLLSGCTQENKSEVIITPLSDYVYSGNTIYDTEDFASEWNYMFSGATEDWHHTKDSKLGISFDNLTMVYPDNSEIYMPKRFISNNQEFLSARSWKLGIIETQKTISSESDFLEVITQSQSGFSNSGCELIVGQGSKTVAGLFTGDRYLVAGYKDFFSFSEDLIGKCPYSWEMLIFPTFVLDKERPQRILVIIDQDGRSGFSYWKGMGTLRW